MPHLHAVPLTSPSQPTFKLEVRRKMAWWTLIEVGPYRLDAWLVLLPKGRRRFNLTRSHLLLGPLCIFVFHRRPKGSAPGRPRSHRRRPRRVVPTDTREPVMN